MRIMIATFSVMGNTVGGVQHVLVNLANEMWKRGHEVSFLYCAEKEEVFYYQIAKEIKCINLIRFMHGREFHTSPPLLYKLQREFYRLFSRDAVKNLRTAFELNKIGDALKVVLEQEKPEIAITSSGNVTTAFYKTESSYRCPVITMCHNNAEMILRGMSNIEKKAMGNSDQIQVLMPHDINVFRREWPSAQLTWIPNSVPQYELEKSAREKLIVNVARIAKKQKRQHLLIKAFSKIAMEFPEWQLELWGEERNGLIYTKELKELINKYNLQKQVRLCGNATDVLAIYHRASIFAFPSEHEGFGLAMTEAMSAGLPVVAYRSCPAVNELVEDGKTGLLVDDGVEALSEGLRKLMKDQALREELGHAAHEAMKAYAPEKIWDQWEALMKDVVAKHAVKE